MKNRNTVVRGVALGLVAAVLASISADSARAQATVPLRGGGQISIKYQFFNGGDHLFSTNAIDGLATRGYVAEGRRWDLGNTYGQTILSTLDVGLHDRLALTLGAAYVFAMYDGHAPVNFEIDDGRWRSTIQDGLVRLRTPFVVGRNLLTPFLDASVRLTDYAVSGHSAAGRGLTAVSGGVYMMRGVGAYSSIGYLSAHLRYGFATNVADRNLRQLHAGLQFAYSQSRRLSLIGSVRHFHTFGGLEWASDDPQEFTAHGPGSAHELVNQVAAARATWLGLGVNWRANSQLGLVVSLDKTVWGENIEDAYVLTAGLEWGFRFLGAESISH